MISLKSPPIGGLFFLIVRLGLGATWIVAAVPKLMNPLDFLSGVYNYDIVNPTFGILIAIIVPALELLLGICLILGFFVNASIALSLILLTVFGLAQTSAIIRGLEISCSCFGIDSSAGEETISYLTLIRSASLLCACLALCLPRARRAFPASP